MEIVIANESHFKYAQIICDTIAESAKIRGTGIAKRTPEYIMKRLQNGNAIIALDGDKFAGFCYIEVWGNKDFVANSGLIVHPDYRNQGLAKQIKKAVFDLSRKKFPDAKIFGITTGLAVMKMNYELGYKPVTFSELTDDPEFWKGCQTCKNFDILTRTEQKMCLCTGMLYDPNAKKAEEPKKLNSKAFQRLKQIKETLFLKKKQK
ncbi:GNAT family N-acetyltransferase [Flagellimonas taeanensis]|jgi:GNAT superfamily N-acetyltransferase|uniref:Acetyltransferase (GNAT) domain-containing protein n=1 Tax=Flagellimonas taeanensis TaxID=1005926 RepID=A0A1M6PCU4_9FLAO|nr:MULTISPECIES: GNAT family N-acetyltransferase [Allomuricauda]MDC6385044.1 GNAT family N-acetyltransferase [Muricauda sp. SK9]MEE1961217.1 GNAT family N-acetyltransferase [Allomuricauda taeanensis]RIV48987.1 GNAT family N-acetyltransferase [Allomuricauda taeanensis]SFB66599.1 Acetyltransferase (GNAT) domain-containing protein [Allomuricauda taeanensis]SHK05766.1 Acetyltransferase (GNAT) family protein [Allomuricauda taeanensis]